MEHIEEAGIHSGDSACALPPVTLGRSDIEKVRQATEAIAHGIGVVGLLNVQYALKDDVLYVLEANPRASRTVPFVSKATAIPLAKACARIMLGTTISQLREEGMLVASGDGASVAPHAPIAVKEAVLPFHRFRRADGAAIDSLLGPEMKSTGEVMGIDRDFGTRLRQEPDRRVRVAAGLGHGIRLGCQPRQAVPGVSGQAAGGSGFPYPRHRGHRGNVAPQWNSLRRGAQAFRVAATGPARAVRGRRDQGGCGRHGDQHALRELRPAHRRLRNPFGRGVGQHPLRDDRAGGIGGRTGHRGGHPRRYRGAVAAGAAQRDRRGGPAEKDAQ